MKTLCRVKKPNKNNAFEEDLKWDSKETWVTLFFFFFYQQHFIFLFQLRKIGSFLTAHDVISLLCHSAAAEIAGLQREELAARSDASVAADQRSFKRQEVIKGRSERSKRLTYANVKQKCDLSERLHGCAALMCCASHPRQLHLSGVSQRSLPPAAEPLASNPPPPSPPDLSAIASSDSRTPFTWKSRRNPVSLFTAKIRGQTFLQTGTQTWWALWSGGAAVTAGLRWIGGISGFLEGKKPTEI